MNKSSQYNQQQTEPNQCKSEVEELCINQNLETGHCNISENKCKEIVRFNARENFSEEI